MKTKEQNLKGSKIEINLDFWKDDPQYRVLRAVIENDGKSLSLREYGKLTMFNKNTPQRTKHHLQRLLDRGMIFVSQGVFDVTYSNSKKVYRVSPELKKYLIISPRD